MSFFKKLELSIILFVVAGCAGFPTTMISSTSPVPAGVRGTIPTYGSDCQFYLLGFIPITSTPNSQAALEDAKRSINVDVLTDVTVDRGGGYYLLFSNSCVRVRGKGVERRVLAESLHNAEIGQTAAR